MRRFPIVLLLAAAAFAQNTAKFPASVVTLQDLSVAKDAPNRSVLVGAITDVATTAVVADGSVFRQYGIVMFADNGEQVMICSISSNTLTFCGRHFAGTTAAAHGDGIGVLGNISAWPQNQIVAELIAMQTSLGAGMAYVISPTVLAAWTGSSNITAIGTLASGTVPWARLSSVPSTFAPSAHTHSVSDLTTVGDWSSKITLGTYSISISGNATTVTNGVYTTGGPYSDPSWLSISKSKVGLGSVENTALSTWAGSTNLTTLGNFTGGSGTLTGNLTVGSGTNTLPSTSAGAATFWLKGTNDYRVTLNDSTGNVNEYLNAYYDSGVSQHRCIVTAVSPARITMTSGTITLNSSSTPCTNVGDSITWNAALSTDTAGNVTFPKNVTVTGTLTGTASNATTAGGLAVGTTANTGANQIVRTDASGYANFGWINTVSGDNGTTAITRVYASHDAYLRYYTLANFTKQVVNAYTHEASFTWQDNYIALPLSTVQWGVFGAAASQNTITSVRCSSDTGDAVLQLRRSDGGDMISGNVGCASGAAGTLSTSLNGYAAIPTTYYVGMWAVSGTAKRINVIVTYTTSY